MTGRVGIRRAASSLTSAEQVSDDGRLIAGENIVYCISGFVRSQGESDDSINRLAQRDGLLKVGTLGAHGRGCGGKLC